MVDCSIVIVNYNTRDLLGKCLASLEKRVQGLSYDVTVVDNASVDGSAVMVQQKFPKVRLIESPENLYFTKGNNLALKDAEGRYLVILNPDTVLEEDAFSTMVRFMDSHPEAGACGPKFKNADGTLQGIGHRFPSIAYGFFELSLLNALFPNNAVRRSRVYEDLDPAVTQEIDATGGSCMMVRRETALEVGFLDEGYLMYAEETDWCRRIRNSGKKIYYVADASIVHYGGQATVQVQNRKIEKIFRQSLLRYYRKWHGFAVYAVLSAISCMTFHALAVYRFLKPK